MAAGLALGFLARQTGDAPAALGAALHTIGQIFVQLLKALVPALVFTALAVFRRLLRWVIVLTPIGSAALIGDAVVRYGWETLSSLGAFAGAVYLGLALVLFAVYPCC